MYLEKQLIMTIGMTDNNWELTREMVENSLGSFPNKPIIHNKTTKGYIDNPVVGLIAQIPNVIIEENNVYADIYIFDDFDGWNGKFDNWCIQPSDDWKSFKLMSIEVF